MTERHKTLDWSPPHDNLDCDSDFEKSPREQRRRGGRRTIGVIINQLHRVHPIMDTTSNNTDSPNSDSPQRFRWRRTSLLFLKFKTLNFFHISYKLRRMKMILNSQSRRTLGM